MELNSNSDFSCYGDAFPESTAKRWKKRKKSKKKAGRTLLSKGTLQSSSQRKWTTFTWLVKNAWKPGNLGENSTKPGTLLEFLWVLFLSWRFNLVCSPTVPVGLGHGYGWMEGHQCPWELEECCWQCSQPVLYFFRTEQSSQPYSSHFHLAPNKLCVFHSEQTPLCPYPLWGPSPS